MRSRLAPVRALLAGSVLSLAVAATVMGYAGQVAATVQVSSPSGTQACGTPITISATIEDGQGSAISGQPVAWSFGAGAVDGDTILDDSTTTNSNGVATTQIKLACAQHSVTVLAIADEVEGTVVVRSSGEGLPRTDTAITPASSEFPGVMLAAVAVLLGSALILRRFAVARR